MGVLISGRGSNLAALIAAAHQAGYPAEIALVVSNRADAAGLAFAKDVGIATRVIDHRPFRGEREAHERAVDAALREAGVELVALAGYLRVFTPWFVQAWLERMINIHPSLLPAFPGLDTHIRVLRAGAEVHGATVHWVSEDVDAGEIIGQAEVPVAPDDDAQSLAARVLAAEHSLYPACLARAALIVRASGES